MCRNCRHKTLDTYTSPQWFKHLRTDISSSDWTNGLQNSNTNYPKGNNFTKDETSNEGVRIMLISDIC